MTTITTERSPVLLRATSMTGAISPRISLKHDISPPSTPDSQLFHLHERLNQLDATIHDIRASTLTKESYADRRNREDEFLRREFESHRVRIDSYGGKTRSDLSQVRTDISQLSTEVIQLRSTLDQYASKDGYRSSDITRLHAQIDQLYPDLQRMHSEICVARTDISEAQSIVSQLRIDFLILQRESRQSFGDMRSRFDMLDFRIKHMDRVRFNSLAQTAYAPITPVPIFTEDGAIKFPDYFPRSVWNFWCLKKASKAHRLVELAEFYQLEGYQYWGRMHGSMFQDGYDSDSSESSELPSDLTRTEASRLYPEACHQALAATLGLVYYKIRNEMGEGHRSHVDHNNVGSKRRRDDGGYVHSSSKRPKATRRSQDTVSTSAGPNKILTNFIASQQPLVADAKSVSSEGFDKIAWNFDASQISEETMSKINDLVKDEPNALMLLQALEHGRVKIQPSHIEAGRTSPVDSVKSPKVARRTTFGVPVLQVVAEAKSDDLPSEVNTVPTQAMSPTLLRSSDQDDDDCPPSSSPPEAKE